MHVDLYQRGHFVYADRNEPDGIRLIAPDGREYRRPVFRHQPAEFTYDEHGYETEVAGELDLLRLAALDCVVDLARRYGIRLKLCLEHFRCFGDGSFPSRVLRHPEDGRTPRDMDEWFQSPDWQGLWRRKLEALLARYADDPVVMAWELWNEINCCYTSSFHIQEEWTRRQRAYLALGRSLCGFEKPLARLPGSGRRTAWRRGRPRGVRTDRSQRRYILVPRAARALGRIALVAQQGGPLGSCAA